MCVECDRDIRQGPDGDDLDRTRRGRSQGVQKVWCRTRLVGWRFGKVEVVCRVAPLVGESAQDTDCLLGTARHRHPAEVQRFQDASSVGDSGLATRLSGPGQRDADQLVAEIAGQEDERSDVGHGRGVVEDDGRPFVGRQGIRRRIPW